MDRTTKACAKHHGGEDPVPGRNAADDVGAGVPAGAGGFMRAGPLFPIRISRRPCRGSTPSLPTRTWRPTACRSRRRWESSSTRWWAWEKRTAGKAGPTAQMDQPTLFLNLMKSERVNPSDLDDLIPTLTFWTRCRILPSWGRPRSHSRQVLLFGLFLVLKARGLPKEGISGVPPGRLSPAKLREQIAVAPL